MAMYSQFSMIVSADTLETFEAVYSDFKRKDQPEAVNYVSQTWIEPWKQELIPVYINDIRHFNHMVSSICEGSHLKLKQYIR